MIPEEDNLGLEYSVPADTPQPLPAAVRSEIYSLQLMVETLSDLLLKVNDELGPAAPRELEHWSVAARDAVGLDIDVAMQQVRYVHKSGEFFEWPLKGRPMSHGRKFAVLPGPVHTYDGPGAPMLLDDEGPVLRVTTKWEQELCRELAPFVDYSVCLTFIPHDSNQRKPA